MKKVILAAALVVALPFAAFADSLAAASFDFNWDSTGNNNNGLSLFFNEHRFYHTLLNNTQISESYSGLTSPAIDDSNRTNSQDFTLGESAFGPTNLSGTGSLIAYSYAERKSFDKGENANAAANLNFVSSFNFVPAGTNANVVNLAGTLTSEFVHVDTLPTTMWAANTSLLIRHDLKIWGEYYDSDGDGSADKMQVWNGVIWGVYDHSFNSLVTPVQDLNANIVVAESVDVNPFSSGFSAFKSTDDDLVWNSNFTPTQVSYFANVAFGTAAEEKGPGVVTPEPASMLMFGLGGGVLAFLRRKRA